MGRCFRNILQWEQNNIKSRKITNGDYSNLYLAGTKIQKRIQSVTQQNPFEGNVP